MPVTDIDAKYLVVQNRYSSFLKGIVTVERGRMILGKQLNRNL